jgi:hypothetical protein
MRKNPDGSGYYGNYPFKPFMSRKKPALFASKPLIFNKTWAFSGGGDGGAGVKNVGQPFRVAYARLKPRPTKQAGKKRHGGGLN